MSNATRVAAAGLAVMLAGALAAAGGPGQGAGDASAKRLRIVTVVKRTGIVWFERMEEGIPRPAST